MDSKELAVLVDLTENNRHGEARWYIADKFAYCSDFKQQFELINKLAEIEGHIDAYLLAYRRKLYRQMLERIERHDGSEMAVKINRCL